MGKAIVTRRGGSGVVTGVVTFPDNLTSAPHGIIIPAAVGKKNIIVYMKSVYLGGGESYIICAHSVDGDGYAVGYTDAVGILSKSATWNSASGNFYCSEYWFFLPSNLYYFVAW
jgi:hypothetical protein